TANLAAKHAGMEAAVYFAHYQMPVAIAVMLVVSVLVFFTAKYYDKKDGHVVTSQAANDVATQGEDGEKVPGLYAFLP
ncbi:transporter, partial [Escherichia coli]|nr:transporter [Escherichia coli]